MKLCLQFFAAIDNCPLEDRDRHFLLHVEAQELVELPGVEVAQTGLECPVVFDVDLVRIEVCDVPVGVIDAEVELMLRRDAVEAHMSEVEEVDRPLLEELLLARDATTFSSDYIVDQFNRSWCLLGKRANEGVDTGFEVVWLDECHRLDE